MRAPRARAVHSHAAHGGARKAGDDDGGGDGDPPSPEHKPVKLIEELARSPRSDLRVLAALATIALECGGAAP
jgi:hypothetical protein